MYRIAEFYFCSERLNCGIISEEFTLGTWLENKGQLNKLDNNVTEYLNRS